MADRPWSDADRELVAEALFRADDPDDDRTWEQISHYYPALVRVQLRPRAAAVLDALTTDGWRDVRGLEKPDSILCDCDPDQDGHEPTNPTTGERMDHHCECTAVETVAQLLGETATTHYRQCVCKRPRGESDA